MKLFHTYFLAICIMLGAIIFPPGCANSTLTNAQYAASVTTLTVETAQDGAVATYRAEQESTLAQAVREGVPRATAEVRIKVVRDKWAPLWEAFSGVRVCHAALVEALQGLSEEDDIPLLYSNLIRAQRELGDTLAKFRKVQ